MTGEKSGDVRVWQTKYDTALRHIDTGNIAEARKVLSQLAKEAPSEDIRKLSAQQLEQFRPDWLAYAFLGGTLLVLIVIAIKYVF